MIYLSFLANKGKFIGKLKCRIKKHSKYICQKIEFVTPEFWLFTKNNNFGWWNTIHHKVWTIRFIFKISFFTFICQLKIQKCTFRMQKRIFWLYKWITIILRQRLPNENQTNTHHSFTSGFAMKVEIWQKVKPSILVRL